MFRREESSFMQGVAKARQYDFIDVYFSNLQHVYATSYLPIVCRKTIVHRIGKASGYNTGF